MLCKIPLIVVLTIPAALIASGCGPTRPIVPVEVKVICRGQPVEMAQVMFSSPEGRPSYGRTNSEGVCQLTTINVDDGAYVGEHRVAITKQVEVPSHLRSPDFRPGGRLEHYNPELRHVLPLKYASLVKSPLKATVQAGTENSFTFDLQD